MPRQITYPEHYPPPPPLPQPPPPNHQYHPHHPYNQHQQHHGEPPRGEEQRRYYPPHHHHHTHHAPPPPPPHHSTHAPPPHHHDRRSAAPPYPQPYLTANSRSLSSLADAADAHKHAKAATTTTTGGAANGDVEEQDDGSADNNQAQRASAVPWHSIDEGETTDNGLFPMPPNPTMHYHHHVNTHTHAHGHPQYYEQHRGYNNIHRQQYSHEEGRYHPPQPPLPAATATREEADDVSPSKKRAKTNENEHQNHQQHDDEGGGATAADFQPRENGTIPNAAGDDQSKEAVSGARSGSRYNTRSKSKEAKGSNSVGEGEDESQPNDNDAAASAEEQTGGETARKKSGEPTDYQQPYEQQQHGECNNKRDEGKGRSSSSSSGFNNLPHYPAAHYQQTHGQYPPHHAHYHHDERYNKQSPSVVGGSGSWEQQKNRDYYPSGPPHYQPHHPPQYSHNQQQHPHSEHERHQQGQYPPPYPPHNHHHQHSYAHHHDNSRNGRQPHAPHPSEHPPSRAQPEHSPAHYAPRPPPPGYHEFMPPPTKRPMMYPPSRDDRAGYNPSPSSAAEHPHHGYHPAPSGPSDGHTHPYQHHHPQPPGHNGRHYAFHPHGAPPPPPPPPTMAHVHETRPPPGLPPSQQQQQEHDPKRPSLDDTTPNDTTLNDPLKDSRHESLLASYPPPPPLPPAVPPGREGVAAGREYSYHPPPAAMWHPHGHGHPLPTATAHSLHHPPPPPMIAPAIQPHHQPKDGKKRKKNITSASSGAYPTAENAHVQVAAHALAAHPAMNTQPIDMQIVSSYHLSKDEILPVYKYTTKHKNKTWKEMIERFEEFVEREGHGDVERDDLVVRQIRNMLDDGVVDADGTNEDREGSRAEEEGSDGLKKQDSSDKTNKEDETEQQSPKKKSSTTSNAAAAAAAAAGDKEENDDIIMLRSWIREIRWIIRSEGLIQEADRLPQRATKSASAVARTTSNKSNTNSSSNNNNNNGTSSSSMPLERCDSENVTMERLAHLEALPYFPIQTNVTYVDDKAKRDSVYMLQVLRDRSSFQRWLDDLMHYRAKQHCIAGGDGNNGEQEVFGGDCNVPLKYAEYPGLGNFVNRQRTEYRKLLQGKASSMTATKIQQLDRVNFTWSIREGGHATWESRLAELHSYQLSNGHTNVPKQYPPNPSLGYWVNEQRFQHRRLMKGQSSYMTQPKIAALNAMQFKWSLRESKRPWSEWIQELRQYKAEQGDCNVPLKYEKNVPLGSFVNNQRSEYRRYKQGKGPTSMNEEKIRELESLGFMWNVRDTRTPWGVRLEELRAYKKKHGNCNIPNNWPEHQPLATWVSKQRQQYKIYARGDTCQLTEERVKQLNEIGFEWKFTSVSLPTNAFAVPLVHTTTAAGGTTGNSGSAKKEDTIASAGANKTAVLGTA